MEKPTTGTEKPAPVADIPGPPAEPPSNRSAMLVAFIVVFIDLLGFAIVLPLLPILADTYIEVVFDRRIVGLVLGLLYASFSLMQFLFAPLWGRLSDRVGRRPILLLSLAGAAGFYALLGFACQMPTSLAMPAVGLLFLARCGAGIAGATIGTAQAVIADSTPPSQRKHGMALIGAAFGIGFTFGPLLGALALEWFPERPEVVGYSAALLSTIAFVVGFIKLPETRKFSAGTPVARRSWNLGALIAAIGNASIGPIVLVFFLSTLGFAIFETTLPKFLKDSPLLPTARNLARAVAPNAHGDDNHQVWLQNVPARPPWEIAETREINALMPLVFAYIGFILLITQGVIYRVLARRLSEATFMTLGILFMAVGVGVLAIVCHGSYQIIQGEKVVLPLMTLLFGALTAATMGFAFVTPSAQALLSRRTSADRQGEVLGINQSAAALARIFGPLVGFPLYMSTQSHMLLYIFGAALFVLMLPIIPFIRRGEPAEAV